MSTPFAFPSHPIVQNLSAMHPRTGVVSIAASAGTGKTYTLQRLVLDKILRGVPLPKILTITFTNQAAAEMSIRIRHILQEVLLMANSARAPRPAHGPTWTIDAHALGRVEAAIRDFDKAQISTIHSFAQNLLTEHALETRQPFKLTTVDEDELVSESFHHLLRNRWAADPVDRRWLQAWLKVKGIQRLKKNLSTLYGRFHSAELNLKPAADPASALSQLVADLGRPLDQLPCSSRAEQAAIRAEVYHRFYAPFAQDIERRKRERHLLTYHDMLAFLDDALKDSSSALRGTLEERFEIVLIDEFQDTSPTQWSVIQRGFVDQGVQTFLIGDEKQSIYAFQGADLRSYRRAVEEASHEERLGHNYRSTESMVRAYNAIFAAGFFDDPDLYDTPVEPAPPQARLRPWPDPSRTITLFEPSPPEGKDKLNKNEMAKLLRARMADEIRDLLDDPPVLKHDEHREPIHLTPDDIFVLTFTNKEADEFGDALSARLVPYKFFKKTGLFKTSEAREILEVLRAINEPGDRSARRKALLGPFFEVPLQDLLTHDQHGPLNPLLQRWARLASRRDFARLFDDILTRSGVRRRELLRSPSHRRLTNWEHLFEWLAERAAARDMNLAELIEEFESRRNDEPNDDDRDDADTQRLETDRGAVRIATVHKAKGLEAEVVFLCGGFSQLTAHSSYKWLKVFGDPQHGPTAYDRGARDVDQLPEQHADAERAEKQRILYVALTRARTKLYLPFVDEKLREKKSFEPLMKALATLIQNSAHDQPHELIRLERINPDAPATQTPPPAPPSIDPNKLALALTQEPLRRQHHARRQSARILASYSSLTEHDGHLKYAADDPRLARFSRDQILPGQIRAGNCLHHVFEFLDYTSVRGFTDGRAWLGKAADGAQLIDEALELFRFNPAQHRDYLAQVVVDTLTTHLRPANGPVIGPLCALRKDQTRREVSFKLPIPHSGRHPGYFQGEIDLIFSTDDGRIYFADWKSDSRLVGGDDYSSQTLKAHVEQQYPIQAAVYSLAVQQLIGATDQTTYDAKFGGFFYLFARGMTGGHATQGYFFQRPPFSQLVALRDRVASSKTRDALAAAASFSAP